MNTNGTFDWTGIIGLLIIAGIFGYGNGFGFGNNASSQITNDFLYTNLASDVRANANAINTTDRDVLENRYSTQLGLQNLQAQMASCCCDTKTAIHAEGEATRALITQNRISDLEKDLVNANTIISNATQTQNLLSNLGRFVPYSAYNYGTYGTSIY